MNSVGLNSKEINRFRDRNPDFFPPSVWGKCNVEIELENGSDLLPDFFGIEVYGPAGELSSINQVVRMNSMEGLQELVRLAWKKSFSFNWCILFLTVLQSLSDKVRFPLWPVQNAVMFLGLESWRARFCNSCGRPFAAEKPATRFCSSGCVGRARRASRNAWWREHGENWRAQTRSHNRDKKSSNWRQQATRNQTRRHRSSS